jgi:hypothetical protein
MILGILTLLTALTISAIAIYYSVAGLVAIFAAAAIPIIIMGTALEVGKLVTAVWLHKYWQHARWWLKGYLSIAVLVLMFITSMGIFGFLSKAHIEQTSAGTESVAQVQRLESEITRQKEVVNRAEQKIESLQTSGTGNDANVQSQIDKEQGRIESAYTRIQPAIKEQNTIIANVTALFQTELDKIDSELEILQGYVDSNEVKKAQQMIGASADGVFGKKTAEKIGDWKAAKQEERAEWLVKIQESANSATVKAARTEIARLRDNADKQIAQSNELINRLREQLGNTDRADDVDAQVDEQNSRIKTANSEIDTLTDEKYALEGEYRKLEAEVGPIKYIAEFVYGEAADNSMLEEAVRWVIIIIIFVFDPLAVLLLIASQYTFEWRRDQTGGTLPPKSDPDPILPTPPFTDEEWEEAHQEKIEREHTEALEENKAWMAKRQEQARAQLIADNVPPDFATISNELTEEDASALESWNRMVDAAEAAVAEETDEDEDDESVFEGVDKHEAEAMKKWKAEDPQKNKLKTSRINYTLGRIKELPWKKYLEAEPDYQIIPELQEELKKKKSLSWIEKEGSTQVKKTIEKEV